MWFRTGSLRYGTFYTIYNLHAPNLFNIREHSAARYMCIVHQLESQQIDFHRGME